MTSNTPRPAILGYRPGTWTADPTRSAVEFTIRQLVGKVHGRFTDNGATIVTGEDLLTSSVEAHIDVSSIDTGNGRRDEHLRHGHFLDGDAHPSAIYRSTGLRHDEHGLVVDGVLTMHGVAREVPLAMVVEGFPTDSDGSERALFTATTKIRRRDFGIALPMDAARFVIADTVAVRLRIEATLVS